MTDISNSLVRARDFCACVFHKSGQSFKDFILTSTLTNQKVYTENVKSLVWAKIFILYGFKFY